ncbi:MAG: TIGR02597 family protein [Lentimonas sp.]
MKPHLKTTSVLAAALLLTASAASAQTVVATQPVGYLTVNVPAGDDALLGISLTQPSAVTGSAANVSGATFDSPTALTEDNLNNDYYVLATSGTNAGQWSEVVDNSTSSITTSEELLADGDTFKVIPFWTLSTLFPQGGGVGASADPFNPSAVVLVNDLEAEGVNLSSSAAFFYFAGPNPQAGWYQSGNFAASDNLRLSPETYITVRNNSNEALSIVNTGTVPVDVVGSEVVARGSADQDNQVVNPYPSALTLSNSGLTQVVAAAADPFNPVDTVLLFDNDASTGQNISSSAAYFYYAGPNPAAGWYQTGSFAAGDNVEIPAAGALIIRKGSGEDEVIAWNPPVPYTID